MIKAYYDRDISCLANKIVIRDEEDTFYTFEIKEHKIAKGAIAPCTEWDFSDNKTQQILSGLGQALIQADIIQETATTAELKACKRHLEDMRKLAGINSV